MNKAPTIRLEQYKQIQSMLEPGEEPDAQAIKAMASVAGVNTSVVKYAWNTGWPSLGMPPLRHVTARVAATREEIEDTHAQVALGDMQSAMSGKPRVSAVPLPGLAPITVEGRALEERIQHAVNTLKTEDKMVTAVNLGAAMAQGLATGILQKFYDQAPKIMEMLTNALVSAVQKKDVEMALGLLDRFMLYQQKAQAITSGAVRLNRLQRGEPEAIIAIQNEAAALAQEREESRRAPAHAETLQRDLNEYLRSNRVIEADNAMQRDVDLLLNKAQVWQKDRHREKEGL